jgi:hypothetical protein
LCNKTANNYKTFNKLAKNLDEKTCQKWKNKLPLIYQFKAMATTELIIETPCKFADTICEVYAAAEITNRQQLAAEISAALPGLLTGCGGSHVWVSLPNGERIAHVIFKD